MRRDEPELPARLEGLRDIAIVGDVRGAGFFWGIELVADPAAKTPFDPDAAAAVVAFLGPELHRRGLICRAADRGYPVIQLAPPLVAGPDEFAEIARILRGALEARRGRRSRGLTARMRRRRRQQPAARPARARGARARRGARTTPGWASSTPPAGSGSTRARLRGRCERWPTTDLAERDAASRAYRLGPRVFAYAALVSERRLLRTAPPVLERLVASARRARPPERARRRRGAHAALALARRMRCRRRAGRAAACPRTALPPAARCSPTTTRRRCARCSAASSWRRAGRTRSRAFAELDARVREAAGRGYAVADEELEPGLAAVAAPVRRFDGRIVAARERVRAVVPLRARGWRRPARRSRAPPRLSAQLLELLRGCS